MEKKFRLKEIMADRGFTNVALAKQLGYTEVAVSNMVRGKTLPSLNTLEKIADLLGVGMRDFFDDETAKSPATEFTCPHCGKPIHVKLEKGDGE
ncbi:MAG: helix-turn-helix domain-containing protein [Prevotella sp.]|nr:helix-turn-helix domain-containing protein [Prevotella sp.]